MLSIVNTYYKKLRKQPEEQSDQENGEPPQEEEDLEYAVITPYEGQRNLIISMFKEQEVEQKVFNLDSFQVGRTFMAYPQTFLMTWPARNIGKRGGLYYYFYRQDHGTWIFIFDQPVERIAHTVQMRVGGCDSKRLCPARRWPPPRIVVQP